MQSQLLAEKYVTCSYYYSDQVDNPCARLSNSFPNESTNSNVAD